MHQGDRYYQPTINHYYHHPPRRDSLDAALKWLLNLEFAHRWHFHCGKRMPGTGEWLLNHKYFTPWLSAQTSNSVLWLKGQPGTGKTTLFALVIEHIQKNLLQTSAIVYSFFEYSRKQALTAEAVLEDLLRQLISRNTDTCQRIAEKLYEAAEAGHRRPTFEELKNAFKEVVQTYDRVSVAIDALDECEHVVRRKLLVALESLLLDNLSLFVTSRNFIDITKYLPSSSIKTIGVEIGSADIKRYFLARIADSEDLESIFSVHEQGVEALVNDIISKADFRYDKRMISCFCL